MTAAEFRETVKRLGLSQAEAARRLNVTTQAVWNWADGRRKISDSTSKVIYNWISEATAVAFTVVFRNGPREHVYLVIANERAEFRVYVASVTPMSEGAETHEPYLHVKRSDAADPIEVGRMAIAALRSLPSNREMELHVYGPRPMLLKPRGGPAVNV